MPEGNVLLASERDSKDAASRRHRSLSGNQGKAQLAASCPAASAIRWLFADDPRLSNAARYSWCQRIWRTVVSERSNSATTPGQLSSSLRIQARLISRTPTSMPLVQFTPDRNG